MKEEFYQRLKSEIERVLDNFSFNEKNKVYQRLYFSSLASHTSEKKAKSSAENGVKGGRPRMSVDKMKNPKQALWRRQRRAELKNKNNLK